MKNPLKSKSGPQGVLLGVHGTSGSPKWSPRTPKSHPEMAKWRSQAFQNHIFLMFSNACHTNHQMHVDRGPAAEGVALKIRRTPCRGAAGRDGIATEKKLQEGFRWHHPLPQAPPVHLTRTPRKSSKSRSSKKTLTSSKMHSFLNLGRHPKSSKASKNAIPELPRTPSENSVEIYRFF